MTKFNIYNHELLQPQAVKSGWSWPAFFFTFIWGLTTKLWGVFTISFILWVLALGIIFSYTSSYETFDIISVGIAGIFFQIAYGRKGNDWRVEKLSKLGYKYIETVSEINPKSALAQHRINLSEQLSESTIDPKPESVKYIKTDGSESTIDPKPESVKYIKTDGSEIVSEKQKKEKIGLDQAILALISESPGILAREIANKLKVDEDEIDNRLDGGLKEQVKQDSEFKWYLNVYFDGVMCSPGDLPKGLPPENPVTVKKIVAKEGDFVQFNESIILNLDYKDFTGIDIVPADSGFIKHIFVTKGQEVKPGTKLFELTDKYSDNEELDEPVSDLKPKYLNELKELKLLLDDGAINKFEYEQLKKKIIKNF